MRHALAAFESSVPAIPVHVVDRQSLAETLADLPAATRGFAEASGFDGAAGQLLAVPDAGGAISSILFGVANASEPGFAIGDLARKLPGGTFRIAGSGEEAGTCLRARLLPVREVSQARREETPRFDGRA